VVELRAAGYHAVARELQRLIERETRDTPIGAEMIERWFDSSDRYRQRVPGYDSGRKI